MEKNIPGVDQTVPSKVWDTEKGQAVQQRQARNVTVLLTVEIKSEY